MVIYKLEKRWFSKELTYPTCSWIMTTYLEARSLMEHSSPSEEMNLHVSVIILHNI